VTAMKQNIVYRVHHLDRWETLPPGKSYLLDQIGTNLNEYAYYLSMHNRGNLPTLYIIKEYEYGPRKHQHCKTTDLDDALKQWELWTGRRIMLETKCDTNGFN
jgi:hypothetical protein